MQASRTELNKEEERIAALLFRDGIVFLNEKHWARLERVVPDWNAISAGRT